MSANFYLILQPHSLSNPSGEYRVVDLEQWYRFTNGETTSYRVAASAPTYLEAEAACDRLNAA